MYNGHVNTLDLTDGADTATATFSGSITGSPKATSVLICYVKDQNNPDAVNINTTGEYTYAAGAFLGQDGTAAGAARCNLYFGTTTYGDGSNISCDLTTAPALPAETLADYCYSHMFYGCNALTASPVLLATTLRTSCYRYMFNGCSNLRFITCLATKNRLSNCTSAWVGGVAFSGTFTKAKGQSWPSGTSGIPTHWEVMEK